MSLGYFDDKFLHLFVRRRTKRPPMINRGYFARVQAIRQVMRAFMDRTTDRDTGVCKGQVLSLGAGWDTTFFRLSAEALSSSSSSSAGTPMKYIEVDHKEVTLGKCRSVQKNAMLSDLLSKEKATKSDIEGTCNEGNNVSISLEEGVIRSPKYALIPCDLRRVDLLKDRLENLAEMRYESPTLVVLECVTAYLDGSATRALLGYVASHFKHCCVLVYDMIGPNDPFGQQLIMNVEARGCPLPGIRSFPTRDSHVQLLRDSGFEQAGCHDMLDIYNRYVDQTERKRIERLQFLDELEEWNLIMSHYCISYAFKGNSHFFMSKDMPLDLNQRQQQVHQRDVVPPVKEDPRYMM